MLRLFAKQLAGEKITLKLAGLHCTSCAMNIDGALEDAPGIYRATTNYAKSQVEIEFDPQKITPQQMTTLITDQGYSVES